MAELDTLDIIVLAIILLATAAYFTKGKLWGVTKDPYANSFAQANGQKAGKTRNIIEKMEESGKNCIIFYGSQTGTAEDYASRLAKEGKSRFGLETMVADLEDYDFDNLDAVPNDKIVMFVLATYGEGEPTDNAVEFYEFIIGEDVAFSESNDPPLGNLNFVAFGLGNNTYEHYNSMVRNVNKALEKLGAHRIGEAGEGDDGAGTMEEDFLAWKDPMWAALAEKMGLEEREAVYEPIFSIVDREGMTKDSADVYLGEPNKMHLEGSARGPFNAHNPYIAPIAESYELFSVKDRNCLHMEIDVSGSNLSYQTGDHVAVWPTNPGEEVDRFLGILDLADKRDNVVSVKALEPTAKVPFPTPTTFDAIVRYHMEICAPVSRQFLATLAAFAPDEDTKAEMTKLGGDKDYFHQKVSIHHLNIARVLSSVSKGKKWTNVPFSAIIEGLTKLQPRYYSISSSSLVNPKKIAITAVVESQMIPGRSDPFRGVATNYLLALKQKQNGDPNPSAFGQTYEIYGPRNKYDGIHVPVHVRHSNFKLPSDPSKPVILVGPGTGVAPFRGFLQERAKQVENGEPIGKTILFFGCRKRGEDFLYEKEWEVRLIPSDQDSPRGANLDVQEYKKVMGDSFELVTAFSREGPKKVYVQHRLKEKAKEVNELLQKKAYFYVCGDAANMAREVNTVLAQILSEERGISEAKAEEIVKGMRAANQYQVRPTSPKHFPSTAYTSKSPSYTIILGSGCGDPMLTLQSIGGCLVLEREPVSASTTTVRGSVGNIREVPYIHS
jgi:NADPH-ferrihemoprotein reductase